MLLCWIFFSLLLRAGIQQILSTNLSFLLLYLSWGPTYWFHSARYTCRRIERMAGCCSDSRDTLCCRIIPWQEMHDQSFGSDGTKQIFQGDLSYRLSFSSLLLNYCCLKSMLLSKVHLIHFSCWLQAIVTDEDDMESIANRFLSAAMKACSWLADPLLVVIHYVSIYRSHFCCFFFLPCSWIVNPQSVSCSRTTQGASQPPTTVLWWQLHWLVLIQRMDLFVETLVSPILTFLADTV